MEKIKEEVVEECSGIIEKIKDEVAKAIVGQREVLHGFIRAILCDGHVLLEGVPGIAKTLMIRALAAVTGCEFKRIQFTVDLLPTDILGITTFTPQKGFEVVKGPIFANFVIADEINRSPPKTQSALLEAMQERQVTIGKKTFKLPNPFFVMANQNPLETSGVYLLPEAQLDRFIFKILMGYPNKEEEQKILKQNINLMKFEDFGIKPIINAEIIIKMQELTRRVYLDKDIEKYIVKIVALTRDKKALEKSHFIEWGASPRASINIFIGSKAQALVKGRNFVTPQDVKDVAYDVLRHRVILNYEATASGIKSEDVIKGILEKVPVP